MAVKKLLRKELNLVEFYKTLDEENINIIVEKINFKQSISEIIREIMDSYRKTGKIGNAVPDDGDHARQMALAIAYQTKKYQD